MSNDTKFRQLGEMLGRCNYEEGESPQNKFDNGDDPQPQPDGTRFVSFGEDVLSSSVNRGLVALAANTDTLYLLGKQYSPMLVGFSVNFDAAWAGQAKFNLVPLVARVWPKKVTSNAGSATNTSITDTAVDFLELGVKTGDRVIFDSGTADEEIVTVTGVAQHVLTTSLITNALHKGTPPANPGYAVLTLPWVHLLDNPLSDSEHALSLTDKDGRSLIDSVSGDVLQFRRFLVDGAAVASSSDVLLTGTIKDGGVHRYYVEIESGDFNLRNIQPGCWVELANMRPTPGWDHLNGFYPVVAVDGPKVYLGARVGATLPVPQDVTNYGKLYELFSTPAPLISYPAEEPPLLAPGDVRGTVNVYPGWFYPLGNDQFDLWAEMDHNFPSTTECPQLANPLRMHLTLMLPASMPSTSGNIAFGDTQLLRRQWETSLTLQAVYNGLRPSNAACTSGRTINAVYGPVDIYSNADPGDASYESPTPALLMLRDVTNDHRAYALMALNAVGSNGFRGISVPTTSAEGVGYTASGDMLTLDESDDIFKLSHSMADHAGDQDYLRQPSLLVIGRSERGRMYEVLARTAAGAASTIQLRNLDGSVPTLAPANDYTVILVNPTLDVGTVFGTLSVSEPTTTNWRGSTERSLLAAFVDKTRAYGGTAMLRTRGFGRFGPALKYREGLEHQPHLFLLRQNYAWSAADPVDQYSRISLITDPEYDSPWADTDTTGSGKGVIEVAGVQTRISSQEGVLIDSAAYSSSGHVKTRMGYLVATKAVGGGSEGPYTFFKGTIFGGAPDFYYASGLMQSGRVVQAVLDPLTLPAANPAPASKTFVLRSDLISPFERPTWPQITLLSGHLRSLGLVNIQLGGVDTTAPFQRYSDFDTLTFAGMDATNTDDGMLYYEIVDGDPGKFIVNVYTSIKTVGYATWVGVDKVAESASTAPGAPLTLTAVDGSGLTGSAISLAATTARAMYPGNNLSFNYVIVGLTNYDPAYDCDDWYIHYYFPTIRDTVGLPGL